MERLLIERHVPAFMAGMAHPQLSAYMRNQHAAGMALAVSGATWRRLASMLGVWTAFAVVVFAGLSVLTASRASVSYVLRGTNDSQLFLACVAATVVVVVALSKASRAYRKHVALLGDRSEWEASKQFLGRFPLVNRLATWLSRTLDEYVDETFVQQSPAASGKDRYGNFLRGVQAEIDAGVAEDCEFAWGPWSQCSEPCEGGTQMREPIVSTPAKGTGRRCPSPEYRRCNEDVPCPRDCEVEFGDWSQCSVDCGDGVQVRTVKRVIREAANGGAACPTREEKACKKAPCRTNCEYVWGEWGECSEPCGGGKQTRDIQIITQPANGGQACPPGRQERACNSDPCPKDCVYTWGAWSECDPATGTRTRSPVVTRQPEGDGAVCPGPETAPCDVDCRVQWSPYGECEGVCGNELTWRYATVVTEPKNQGAACPPMAESQKCVLDRECCDYSGGETTVERCPVFCGGGKATRKRVPVAKGDVTCVEIVDRVDCNTQQCPAFPPVLDGLVSYYCGETVDGNQALRDAMRPTEESDARIAGGAVDVVRLGTRMVVRGKHSVKVYFPDGLLTSKPSYTLFHVTGYSDGATKRGRVLTEDVSGSDWLSGFYLGSAGVAAHGRFLTPESTSLGLTALGRKGVKFMVSIPHVHLDANSTLVHSSDESDADGAYAASASSESDDSSLAHMAFDGGDSSSWRSAHGYGRNGAPNRGTSTSVEGVNVPGEYLQLKTPMQMEVTGYSVTVQHVRSLMLVVSTDGSRWVRVDERVSDPKFSPRSASTHNFGVHQHGRLNRYAFVRLIVTSVFPGSSSPVVSSLRFSGVIFGAGAAGDGSLDWSPLVSTDQRDVYRGAGWRTSVEDAKGTYTPRKLAINTQPGEESDFDFGCLLVYDRELGLDDVLTMETWLASQYGAQLSHASVPRPTSQLQLTQVMRPGLALVNGSFIAYFDPARRRLVVTHVTGYTLWQSPVPADANVHGNVRLVADVDGDLNVQGLVVDQDRVWKAGAPGSSRVLSLQLREDGMLEWNDIVVSSIPYRLAGSAHSDAVLLTSSDVLTSTNQKFQVRLRADGVLAVYDAAAAVVVMTANEREAAYVPSMTYDLRASAEGGVLKVHNRRMARDAWTFESGLPAPVGLRVDDDGSLVAISGASSQTALIGTPKTDLQTDVFEPARPKQAAIRPPPVTSGLRGYFVADTFDASAGVWRNVVQNVGDARVSGARDGNGGASPTPEAPRVRYVLLRRVDGRREAINVSSLVARDEFGSDIVDGVKPSLHPQWGAVDRHGPQLLMPGAVPIASSFVTLVAHTDATPDAFMMLDLGREHRVSGVRVLNRHDCCQDRIVGCSLEMQDADRNVVFAHRITQALPSYDIQASDVLAPASAGAPASVGGARVAYDPSLRRNVLVGDHQVVVAFPPRVLPNKDYTLFYVAKQRGSKRGHVFTDSGGDWTSGFSSGASGVSFHGMWVTGRADAFGNGWIWGTDQMGSLRVNSKDVTLPDVAPGGAMAWPSGGLSINKNGSDRNGDFAVAAVLSYQRRLDASEVGMVERFLRQEFDRSSPVASAPGAAPASAPASSSPVHDLPMIQANPWAFWKGDTLTLGDDQNVWSDASGNGRHVNLVDCNTVSVQQMDTMPSQKCVRGPASCRMSLPLPSDPNNLTIFHVARFAGSGDKKLIFCNSDASWYSGFFDGKSGVAKHGGAQTPMQDVHGEGWVVSSDQLFLYRSNGVNRMPLDSRNAKGVGGNLFVNGNERVLNMGSEFMIACVLVYDKVLGDQQIQVVEEFLRSMYGIRFESAASAASSSSSLSPALDAPLTSLPVKSGLMAYYTPDSFDASARVWRNLAGEGVASRMMDIDVDSPLQKSPDGKEVVGAAKDGSRVLFPSGMLQPDYTLVYVASCSASEASRVTVSRSTADASCPKPSPADLTVTCPENTFVSHGKFDYGKWGRADGLSCTGVTGRNQWVEVHADPKNLWADRIQFQLPPNGGGMALNQYQLQVACQHNTMLFTEENSGPSPGWFSGFSHGRPGWAKHGGVLVASWGERVEAGPVVGVDSPGSFRMNGLDLTLPGADASRAAVPDRIGINVATDPAVHCDFGLRAVLAFSRTLSRDEIAAVESWVAATHRLDVFWHRTIAHAASRLLSANRRFECSWTGGRLALKSGSDPDAGSHPLWVSRAAFATEDANATELVVRARMRQSDAGVAHEIVELVHMNMAKVTSVDDAGGTVVDRVDASGGFLTWTTRAGYFGTDGAPVPASQGGPPTTNLASGDTVAGCYVSVRPVNGRSVRVVRFAMRCARVSEAALLGSGDGGKTWRAVLDLVVDRSGEVDSAVPSATEVYDELRLVVKKAVRATTAAAAVSVQITHLSIVVEPFSAWDARNLHDPIIARTGPGNKALEPVGRGHDVNVRRVLIRRADGQQVPINVNWVKLYDASGDAIPASQLKSSLSPQYGAATSFGAQFLDVGVWRDYHHEFAHTDASPASTVELVVTPPKPLSMVRVHNRYDPNTMDRMVGTVLEVFDSGDQLVASFPVVSVQQVYDFELDHAYVHSSLPTSVSCRYVTLRRPSPTASIGGLESVSFAAFGPDRRQLSQAQLLSSSFARDARKDAILQLDLKAVSPVHKVVLFNRKRTDLSDCIVQMADDAGVARATFVLRTAQVAYTASAPVGLPLTLQVSDDGVVALYGAASSPHPLWTPQPHEFPPVTYDELRRARLVAAYVPQTYSASSGVWQNLLAFTPPPPHSPAGGPAKPHAELVASQSHPPFVRGNRDHVVRLGALPQQNYTVVHVCRYGASSSANGRIITASASDRSAGRDFVSGFANDTYGVAKMGSTWLTPARGSNDFGDWHVTVHSRGYTRPPLSLAPSFYGRLRADGKDVAVNATSLDRSNEPFDPLEVNCVGADASMWEVACVFVYDHELGPKSVQALEAHLMARYRPKASVHRRLLTMDAAPVRLSLTRSVAITSKGQLQVSNNVYTSATADSGATTLHAVRSQNALVVCLGGSSLLHSPCVMRWARYPLPPLSSTPQTGPSLVWDARNNVLNVAIGTDAVALNAKPQPPVLLGTQTPKPQLYRARHVVLRRKDGTQRPVSLRRVMVFGDKGQLIKESSLTVTTSPAPAGSASARSLVSYGSSAGTPFSTAADSRAFIMVSLGADTDIGAVSLTLPDSPREHLIGTGLQLFTDEGAAVYDRALTAEDVAAAELVALPEPRVRAARVRLERVDERPTSINLSGVEVYDGDGRRVTAGLAASLFPLYDAQFGADNLINGSAEIAMTESHPKAFVEIDVRGVPDIGALVIVNRVDCCWDTLVGTSLKVFDMEDGLLMDVRIDEAQPEYIVQVRRHIVLDRFVRRNYYRSGLALDDQGQGRSSMTGTLEECMRACRTNSECAAFARLKGVDPNDSSAQCILQPQFDPASARKNHGQYQTWTKY